MLNQTNTLLDSLSLKQQQKQYLNHDAHSERGLREKEEEQCHQNIPCFDLFFHLSSTSRGGNTVLYQYTVVRGWVVAKLTPA